MELLDRIEAVARDDAGRTAYRLGGGVEVSYAALAERVAASRAVVRRHARPGQAIVAHLGNVPLMPSLIVGALAAGVDVLPVHASASAAEVAALAARVDARLIVTSLTCADFAVPTLAPDAFAAADPAPAAATAGTLLLTSSGSTGVPRIVRRSATSLDAVAANMVEAISFTGSDRVLASVPIAHSYGIEHGLLAPLWAGATIELSDGLDLAHFVAAVERGISIFPTVPAVLERLAEVDGLAKLGDANAIYSAGAPLPDGVRARFVARYGIDVGQLYGSTEVGSVCYRRAGDGSGVGRPMGGVSIRALDLARPGALAAAGATGAIAVRSPSMLERYHDGDPAPIVDGHFLTGDLGHLAADGSLVITGRSKLLIDTGGPKVDPLEVERVLESHPAVACCAVVAMRQSEAVSRLRAIVVARPGAAAPTAEAIRAFALARLAPHKVPRVVEFRDALPRTALGKIARQQLEES